MKKLLFLILLPLWVNAQVSTGKEQKFTNGIRNTSSQKILVPDTLVTRGADGTYGHTLSVMNQNTQTGVISFSGLAINVDPTKFNIGAGVGYISNPQTGEVKKVVWNAQTEQTTPYLATSVATYVLKNNLGTTVLQNSYPSPEQFRTHIYLGKLAHTTFTTILFAVNDPNRAYHVAGDLHDLVNSFGSINRSGNAITPNGANLQINVSAGETYREGANFLTNTNSPNITTEPAVNATSFRNKFRNGSGGWTAVNTTTVDPNYYDDGSGILQLVPNNKFTVKVVYRFGGTGTIHMDYGQAVYDDMDKADAGISNAVASDPDTKGFASRIGWIIVKQGTTSLLTSGNYRFVAADKIGERAATSSPTVHLQTAYDGSVTPQIVTSTGGGAVAIRRGSGADTDTILAGQNGSGVTTSSVKGNGEIYTATAPTPTAFTHYFGQTASDGIIRPKTLANVRTEIVTTASVDAAKPNIVTGTGTNGTFPIFTGTGTIGNSLITVHSSGDPVIRGTRIGIGANNGVNFGVLAGVQVFPSGIAVTDQGNSIFIGNESRPITATPLNEIAIGYQARSLGSNTSVIGNSSTTQTWVGGKLTVGKSTNDGVNDIQANGTVSSGNTTLGTSQPTANNQLTRKDYVDTADNLKANLASPSFTGTPTAPTATAGTNTNQVATTAFVQGIRPYKVYTALLTQTGTSAPVATVLENTLGGTVTWSRTVPGGYFATLSNAFTTDKTTVLITNGSTNGNYIHGAAVSTTNVNIIAPNDGQIDRATIEIRVYN